MSSDTSAPLFVLSGPSGAGKTTLLTGLIRKTGWRIRQSVSATTRPPRPGELNGIHYHFMEREDFERELAQGGFLEHAEVHGNLYGTPARLVDANAQEGMATVLAIDVQGFRKVRDLRRIDSSVFIALPVEELENRLRLRGTDSDEVIARRLRAAALELSCAHEYEHTLINDNLVEAIDRLATIWGRFFTQAC
jgi:guanylate kinase